MKSRKWAHRAVDALVIAAMTVVLTGLFFVVPISFSTLDSSKTLREQYDLAEIFLNIKDAAYNNSKRVDVTDCDIVIVNTGNPEGRKAYADIIDTVLSAGPRLVGLDILFYSNKEPFADSLLEAELRDNPIVVSPCQLIKTPEDEKNSFGKVKLPFYASDSTNVAAININKTGVQRICRTFTKELSCKDYVYKTLPVAMSELIYPGVSSRGPMTQRINFDRSCFMVLDAKVLGSNLDLLKGKIVFIGDLTYEGDKHITPIDYSMAGTKIQAMALDTIINNKSIKTTPGFVSWLIAFLSVLILLPVLGLARKNSWTEILIPLFQALLIFLSIFIAYIVFVKSGFVPNIVYTMLSIGFMDICRNLYMKLCKR